MSVTAMDKLAQGNIKGLSKNEGGADLAKSSRLYL
jgi:hypothetical protein